MEAGRQRVRGCLPASSAIRISAPVTCPAAAVGREPAQEEARPSAPPSPERAPPWAPAPPERAPAPREPEVRALAERPGQPVDRPERRRPLAGPVRAATGTRA